MAQYFFPPNHSAVSIAPSLLDQRRGVGTEQSEHTVSPVKDAAGLPNGHGQQNGHGTNGTTSKPPLAIDTASDSPKMNGGLAGSHFATKAGYGHTRQHSNPPSPSAPFPTFEEVENPTVVPTALLQQFHFAFLIRHPRYSIPSYYRCCIPPLDEMTGFYNFRPDEAGYDELRRFFDYLRASGQIGPARAGDKGSVKGSGTEICMIDADDLLDHPEEMMKAFCESVGIDWSPEMLNWNSDEDKAFAKESFEKWRGFHEDAIHSNDLKAREHKHTKSDDDLYAEWTEKYGKEGADVIRSTVAECVDDYEYLKQFCVKVDGKP